MTDTSVVDPKTTPPPAPAPVVAVPGTDPAPNVPAADPKPLNPQSPKWALDRISEESAARRAEKQRADAAETRANNAEELLRRMQSGSEPPKPVVVPTQPTLREPPPDAVRQAAQELRFQEDINGVIQAGISEFGIDQFTATSRTLDALGANNDFLADVMAVDKANAHKIFAKIAAEPERAASLARMPSRQRIAEITRMALVPAAATADPAPVTPKTEVSKAPAPPPPIQTGTTAAVEKHWWDEGVDGADCDKLFFDQNRLKQRARR